jgi:hypothetical protein
VTDNGDRIVMLADDARDDDRDRDQRSRRFPPLR